MPKDEVVDKQPNVEAGDQNSLVEAKEASSVALGGMMALTISYFVMIPLLASWIGMGGAKAIYVALLTAMFVAVFAFLEYASA